MDGVVLIGWLVLCPLVGMALGQGKGRGVDGAVFGLMLGPLGWLFVALMPRHEEKNASNSRRYYPPATTNNVKNQPEQAPPESAHHHYLKRAENAVDLETKTYKGWTGLHVAARYGDLRMANFCISHGGELNAKTPEGFTALHIAARYDQVEIIEFLIANGADLNARDRSQYTPIHFAYPGVAALLREHGAK